MTGLARRLLRGSILGWTTGLVLFGFVLGTLADPLEDSIADIPSLTDMLAVALDALTESLAAAMLTYLVLGVVAFSVAAVLRLRGEEEDGRTALALSAGIPRVRWLLGWLAAGFVAFVPRAAASLLGLAGAAFVLVAAAVAGFRRRDLLA